MTTLVVLLIGGGALLLISGIESKSLVQTFTELWSGTTSTTPDISNTPRYTTPQPRNVN